MLEQIKEAIISPRSLLILGILIFLFAVYTLSYSYAQKSPWRMNTEEARKLAKQGDFDLIIDVRTPIERKWFPNEFESTPIAISQLESEVPKSIKTTTKNKTTKKDAKILVFCMSGQRAKYATNKLHKMGYDNTYYITTNF